MSEPSARSDGICQRCSHACVSFPIDRSTTFWYDGERWAGAYVGGVPPNRERMTCLLCLNTEELARVTARNDDGLTEDLLARLRQHRMGAG